MRAVSHSMGAHTAALQPADSDSDDDDADDGDDGSYTNYDIHGATHCGRCSRRHHLRGCEVCFVAPRKGFTLVPCGHARFCESCANRVAVMDTCSVCRSNITMVMRIFM